ncbi:MULTISPECIES: GerAB/ArcD/ProY family transporter [Aneurinibacillus]|uniref:Germination protein n=1 Tax=Aneurinibacillus danicus TaxID=267746 RepID=A0A511V8Z1_9BACL|nr:MULTISPECIES: endospore germination permease [Aneurinibacillus]GEN34063.1 hypothetical protein ADA01nite_15230 [Aneurinibacillus danicus]
MITKQVIDHRQLAWLTASILITETLASIPHGLANISKTDVWFTQIIPILYALLIASFFYTVSKKFPGKNIFEVTSLLLGNWGGKAVNILFFLYIWIILVRDVREISEFVGFFLLSETPSEVILFLFILVMLYYGKTSIEVIARVNALFVPVYLLAMAFLPVLLANEINPERALPILSTGFLPLGTANVIGLSSYGDLLILGAFLPSLADTRLFKASVRYGTLLAGVVITIVLFVAIVAMGATITSKFYYPVYLLVEQIHITDFLDRVEVLLFSAWFPAFTLKIMVLYSAFFICLGAIFNNTDCRKFNIQGGVFIFLTSYFSFERINELAHFIKYSLPLIVLGFQPAFMLLIYTVSKLSKKTTHSNIEITDGQVDESENKQVGSVNTDVDKKPKACRSTWFTWSALAFVILGKVLHSFSMWFAIACAAAYFTSLLLALWFSYQTFRRSRRRSLQENVQHEPSLEGAKG